MNLTSPRPEMPNEFMTFRRDPLGFLTRAARERGDFARLHFGDGDFYLVNHPDLIREVLVTRESEFESAYGTPAVPQLFGNGMLVSQGDYFQKMRRLAQPAFHRQRIASYAATMTEIAVRTRDSWPSDTQIDLASTFGKLTLEIVGQILFSADLRGEAQELFEALDEVQAIMERTIVPDREEDSYAAARTRFEQTFARIVRDRRAQGVAAYDDLLSIFLDPEVGLNDVQVRDELMTIFLAGQETTAVALMWVFYFLSRLPEEEARLMREIENVLGDRRPRSDDVPNLPRAGMVLAEAMRIYPPVWAVARRALRDVTVGEFSVRAGATLILCQYVTHRDARFFPEPERFDPERWTEEEKAKRPAYSYFPFSGGSRRCLGENFALMEGVLLLTTIMQKWKVTVPNDFKIVLAPRVTLRPRFGMPAILTTR